MVKQGVIEWYSDIIEPDIIELQTDDHLFPITDPEGIVKGHVILFYRLFPKTWNKSVVILTRSTYVKLMSIDPVHRGHCFTASLDDLRNPNRFLLIDC